MKFGDAPITPYISVSIEPSPAVRMAQSVPTPELSKIPTRSVDRELTEFERAMHPRGYKYSRVEVLLTELRVPIESGQWTDVKGGWQNDSTGHIFTLADMESLVNARIEELKLDSTLIEKWLTGRHSLAESREFRNLSFNERINRFRKPD